MVRRWQARRLAADARAAPLMYRRDPQATNPLVSVLLQSCASCIEEVRLQLLIGTHTLKPSG